MFKQRKSVASIVSNLTGMIEELNTERDLLLSDALKAEQVAQEALDDAHIARSSMDHANTIAENLQKLLS